MCFGLSSLTKVSRLVIIFAAMLLVFSATSYASKCRNVHYGARYMGWNKPLDSNAWPYYEKNRGTITFEGIKEEDRVYVDGCHASKASSLGRIYMDPGTYRIAVESSGKYVLNQKVSVTNGSNIELDVGKNR